MKTPQELAEEYIRDYYSALAHPEIKGLIETGEEHFLAGYSVAMEQQREFYALVRDMVTYFESSSFMEKQVNISDGNMVKFAATKYDVKKHLSSFTEREQPKD